MNERPRFSIVIPTFQRREVVGRMVAALKMQKERDFEVIVAVDGSTDGTAQTLNEFRVPFPLKIVEQSNRGAAAARNNGASIAKGELLLFLDDDMEADPLMLVEHERSHRDGADVVLGDLPLHSDSPPTLVSQGVGRWAERRRKSLTEDGLDLPVGDLLTGQMSISRAAFERLGGFDESFTRNGLFGGEDLDFGYRAKEAGLRIVFNPAAISYQLYDVDPADYTRRTREAGRSAQELKAKHPQLTQDLRAGREFTSRRSRAVFGTLAVAPPFVSRPLRAFAASRVRRGHLDTRTYRLFFAVQTMEYLRGSRQAVRGQRSGSVVVLAYHAIADLTDDPVLADYGVPPARLAAQLDALARHGRSFVGLDTLLRALDGRQPLPNSAVLVTFDDSYVDLLTEAAPLLVERHIPAVAFAVTDHIGGTNEWDRAIGSSELSLLGQDGLRALVGHGIVIGSHGMTHRPMDELKPSELEEELRGSAARISSMGLPRPTVFSYPHGRWNSSVAAMVQEAGYAAAFTIASGLVRPGTNRYALPRIEVRATDSPRKLRLKLATAGWPARWRSFVLRLATSRPLGGRLPATRLDSRP
jgi:glycosyltransferase involved in cell wall biosynthesis/peptidoglycan/xylan/chitin deacetylase (PgdA/CDA1 family)